MEWMCEHFQPRAVFVSMKYMQMLHLDEITTKYWLCKETVVS
jgi:hypothetical protein